MPNPRLLLTRPKRFGRRRIYLVSLDGGGLSRAWQQKRRLLAGTGWCRRLRPERRPVVPPSHAPSSGFLFAALLIAACGGDDRRTAAASSDAVATLGAADSALQVTIAARDAERTAAFYADDAVLLPVAEPIVEGRAAIQDEWRHVFGIPATPPPSAWLPS